MSAAKYFFDRTHRRVIFEYALIGGVNCTTEHAMELTRLLKTSKISYHVNLINLNSASTTLKSPPRETALKFMDTLIKNDVSCTMRRGRGEDILAACGQLRRAHKTEAPK